MGKVYNYIIKDGFHTCDYEISTMEWLSLLEDKTIFNDIRLTTLKYFYDEPNHKSSCYDVAKKYYQKLNWDSISRLSSSLNAIIVGLGKAICKKIDITIYDSYAENKSYYILLMTGKYITNENGKHFEWTVRPNLVKALDIYFKIGNDENISIIEETIINGENHIEGKKIGYYTAKYERNPKNRQQAIKYHGYSCCICGFNFEKFYGELGKNYIEVHHIKPLSTLEEEIEINPKTDLICVCANCHRMLHRSRTSILEPNDLIKIINKERG